MSADYYYYNNLQDTYILTPSGAGSSVTVNSGSGGTLTIRNIYIPQTRNVQYVYKKLGNLVIDSTDATFDAAKKTKTQYANDPNDATRAADVTLPKITGFVPFINGVAVTDYTFNPAKYITSLDQDVTVVYRAKQKAWVDFIDQDSGNQVIFSSGTLTDYDGQPINFATADQLKQLVYHANTNPDGKYDLVKDGFPAGATYDHNAKVDQSYQVILKHHHETVDGKTEPANGQKTVKRTIEYYYQGDGQAEPSVEQKVTFTRTGDRDRVTGATTWEDWSKVAAQNVEHIDSPKINGYTADKLTVAGITIKATDKDSTVTVTYVPNKQAVNVIYHDDTTNRNLAVKEFSGNSGADSGRNTKATIAEYVKKHLKLVSDSTDGQNVIFDANDAADQSFEVHFKHGTKPTSRNVTYQRVITYIYGNGGKAGQNVFAPNTQTLEFTQNGIQDLVNKQVTWDKLDPQTFTEIASPKMDGYGYDKAVVSAAAIKPTEDAFDKKAVVVNETVTYTAQPQKATVYFIDGTTPAGSQLLFKELSGLSDMNSGYTTTDMIEGLEKLHYQLLTDETNGQEIVFDHDDEDQVYYVYFGHETEKDSRAKTVTETIDYVKDGAVLSDQRVTKELNFTQNGVKDLVNNIVDWNGTWTSTQKFAAVPSPTFKGYKAVPGQVDEIAITVNNDNYNQNLNVYKQVVYTANLQSAYIEYFDQDTGAIIGEKNLTGSSNQLSDYTTGNKIKALEEKGYELVNDETGGQPIRFDDDDNVSQSFVVYLKHRHVAPQVPRSVKVQRVVHYVFRDGPK